MARNQFWLKHNATIIYGMIAVEFIKRSVAILGEVKVSCVS
jgi:hypothetical protein